MVRQRRHHDGAAGLECLEAWPLVQLVLGAVRLGDVGMGGCGGLDPPGPLHRHADAVGAVDGGGGDAERGAQERAWRRVCEEQGRELGEARHRARCMRSDGRGAGALGEAVEVPGDGLGVRPGGLHDR